jgi:glycosyltransferase involved in cell wall biosynthesis
MDRHLTTRGGRPVRVLGDAELITMERWNALGDHLDSDPRIVSCSIVGSEGMSESFLHAPEPDGPVVIVALDVTSLVGDAPERDDAQEWTSWFAAARDRGLRHDHWRTNQVDVRAARPWITATSVDRDDPTCALTYSGGATPPPKSLRVCVDATWLGPYETGAQVLATHALDALARDPRIASLHLVNIDRLPAYAEHLVSHGVITVGPPESAADVVWFPNQIDARINVERSRRWGRRAVCTYLDLIAYDIPKYHADAKAWSAYRSLQRTIALTMDGITTISQDVADRLLAEVPALDANRVRAIPLGLDHIEATTVPAPTDPEIVAMRECLEERPFILVLGNDFSHKNRDFAIKVWERLLDNGCVCDLVLVGLHVRGSSSHHAERTLLDKHTDLRARVVTADHVSSATRTWLLVKAAAVHYPSSAEGFGFVPYEAAALGTPVTFTSFGPLREISGVSDVPRAWDVEAHATDLARLLQDQGAAHARTTALQAPARELTWAHYSSELVSFFEQIVQMPPAPAGLIATRTAMSSPGVVIGRSTRAWARASRAAGRLRGKRP